MKKKTLIIVAVILTVAVSAVFGFNYYKEYSKKQDIIAEAQELCNNQKYESAIELLGINNINGSDVEKTADEAKIKRVYDAAIKYLNNGSYSEAMTLLNLFDDNSSYKDVLEKKNELKEKIYAKSVEEFNNGLTNDHIETLINFRNLKDYKDSKEYVAKILGIYPVYIQEDDYVYIGEYEQDNNIENGKETIKWYVTPSTNNYMILYSSAILDVMAFNETEDFVNAYTTTMSKWLNEDFYNESFNDNEKKFIMNIIHNVDGEKYPARVDIPFTKYPSKKVSVSEYTKAKNILTKNGNPVYWVGHGVTTSVAASGDEDSKEVCTNSNVGVIPTLHILTNPDLIKKCDTCATYYNGDEKCTKCDAMSQDIIKEYFTNKVGKITDKCSYDSCRNYVAYTGQTEHCSKHSTHCQECDIYITDGTKCSSCGSFTNKYGTKNTKCADSKCPSKIAPTGDTRFCKYHSNNCLECRAYIDNDAMYCMSCLEKALKK